MPGNFYLLLQQVPYTCTGYIFRGYVLVVEAASILLSAMLVEP